MLSESHKGLLHQCMPQSCLHLQLVAMRSAERSISATTVWKRWLSEEGSSLGTAAVSGAPVSPHSARTPFDISRTRPRPHSLSCKRRGQERPEIGWSRKLSCLGYLGGGTKLSKTSWTAGRHSCAGRRAFRCRGHVQARPIC